jgi:hypothetical protein
MQEAQFGMPGIPVCFLVNLNILASPPKSGQVAQRGPAATTAQLVV